MRWKSKAKALLSGLLIYAATGCDELDKAVAKQNSEKTEPAKSPNNEVPKPKETTDVFAGIPTTDPSILAASQNRRLVAEREEALLAKLDEIRGLLASAKSDPAKMKTSLEEFLQLAKGVRKIVGEADEALAGLTTATDGLARELKHSPKAYRMAADGFRERAKDYTESSLKDQLLSFASDYEAIAKAMPERIVKLREFQKKLPKMKAKIREARSFLDDMSMYLESHPGVGRSDPRERYSVQFDAFVHTFSELIRALEVYRNVLRSQAVSVSIRKAFGNEANAFFVAWAAFKQDQQTRLCSALERLESRIPKLKALSTENRDPTRLVETLKPQAVPMTLEPAATCTAAYASYVVVSRCQCGATRVIYYTPAPTCYVRTYPVIRRCQ